MTMEWILGWWNLIFVVPFGIALVYLAAYVTTGVDFGDADGEADIDADADAEHSGFDHAGEKIHLDKSHESDGLKSALLGFVGVGHVPLSLLLLIALFTWGISGFAAAQVLHDSIESGPRVGLVALPIALMSTLIVSSLAGRAARRWMPNNEPTATGRRDLVGRPGVAVLGISDTFGLARVSPSDGSAAVQVACRVATDQPVIPAHEPIVVLRFDNAEQLFYVTTPDRLAAFRAADAEVAVNH